MTVYALFRRGNYLYALLASLFMTEGRRATLRTLSRWLGKESWMESALYFTSACAGHGCMLCTVNGRTHKQLTRRDHHVLTVRIDEEHGVRAMVDEAFEKRDAWLFVELPLVSEGEARAFFEYIRNQVTGYNTAGYAYNFLPYPLASSTGVQADNNWRNATRFFCSEMLTAFLQTHRYDMGLVPCKTTPQQLLAALLTRYPALVSKQRMLHPASTALIDKYVLVSVKGERV